MATVEEWQAAKLKLEEAGIKDTQYGELWALLDIVTGMDLEEVRAKQFTESATDLCFAINAASNKNFVKVSAFLREFAEAVANELLAEKGVEEVAALLDTIVLPRKEQA